MSKIASIAAAATIATLSSLFIKSAAADNLKVVSTFSIISDFAKNVGGDRIDLTTLVGPDGDAHVYEPKPADGAALSEADVVLVNGLQFEGFLDRLVEASETKAPIVELTKGVEPLRAMDEEHEHEHEHEGEAAEGHDHDHEHEEEHEHEEGHHHHGEFDPHAWQSVHNAEIYVTNISAAFCSVDQAGCDVYKSNAEAYLAKLKALETSVKAELADIPADKRTVITSHDAFGYFEHEYGLKFLAPEGISTEAEASAADVAKLIDQIKEDKASALFVENITNTALIDQISAETGLKVGGTLYSDALSGPSEPAATYIDMMNHNVATLKKAITGN
ncbi:MAG: zinc ABC transporter substrate-binding protein [Rhodospirillaceae bacterium]|nr:zinc ABC transporter substrate-binding protein [Rhodospirillaceae bacterium]